MPRTITLHPLSLLIGAGFTVLGLVAMAQAPAAKRPAASHDTDFLQVAHPRDWIIVRPGQPFTVPAGKLFVLTAIGQSGPPSQTNNSVDFNGVREASSLDLSTYANAQTWDSATIRPVPVGCSAVAGTLIEVFPSNVGSPARAWGYLVDA